MQSKNHLVIMAGGIGSRFWPMSTPQMPKQFIDVLGVGKTLLQMTLDRFAGICPIENVWIVTSRAYFDIVHEQLPNVPSSNILLEPVMRNTAPCIAYVTWKIKTKCPDANLVVSPADHLVINTDEFRKVVLEGLKFTENSNHILTLGMKPTRPETGYGYIESSSAVSDAEHIHKVKSFKEKPDIKTAEIYYKDDNFYWNSGIFLWNVRTIENALRKFQPKIALVFDKLKDAFYTEEEQKCIDNLFPTCDSISIDYAIMEHSDNIFVLPADFGWSDLGTWGSLHDKLLSDANNNAVVGNNVHLTECNNCTVHVPNEKQVVIQGLDGYIVSEHNGVLMICKIQDEQRIKDFSKLLKNDLKV